MSIWHWVIALIFFASCTIPFFKIFPRAGIPAWIGIFGVISFVPLLYLWVLAFMKWPEDK
jgi:hypothetical protein